MLTEDETYEDDYEESYLEEEGTLEPLPEDETIYDTNDFISYAFQTPMSTVPENILEFQHSYGYDCKKKFNLVLPEENVIVFASGNYINFFDLDSNRIWFRRTAFGEGIGHISTNPNPTYPHIAVAENGFSPPIIIYEWPSLEIVCLLKGGSQRRFTHVCYSPDGDLFCSQSGDPDYLITIWNWKKHSIMLRMKSYVNDVYNVMFSPYISGALATGGIGHIKFWKMCETFTGLKLKGQTGRFGKTEISDIVGLIPMPDGKVCSGCEWGNILVWDEGLIVKEVTRKKQRPCHKSAITQFSYSNGELTTVAMDGYMCIWYYESIELANPPEEARFVHIEPNYEFRLGESNATQTEIMTIIKRRPNDKNDNIFFMQDGNGGILRSDISTEYESAITERIFVCHAGAVADIATCPYSIYFCSLGIDGRLHVYNYLTHEILLIRQFKCKGRQLIWLPLSSEPTGSLLLLGFDDGAIRVVLLDLSRVNKDKDAATKIIQVIKPHTKAITFMRLSPNGRILATTGEDKTLFLFYLKQDVLTKLLPIGFINLDSFGTFLTWKQDDTLFICCQEGHFLEVPILPKLFGTDAVSYLLKDLNPIKNRFVSVKSKLEHDDAVAKWEAHKRETIERKMAEIEKIQQENPGINIDVQEYLGEEEKDPEFPEIYIPPPQPILFGMYTLQDTIWLSIGGFDAGYIYEYTMDSIGPVKVSPLHEISEEHAFCCYLMDDSKNYLILGQTNGQIRICQYNFKNGIDISEFWRLSVHDNVNGLISKMQLSYDQSQLFTCGSDGNIFAHYFNSEFSRPSDFVPPKPIPIPKNVVAVADIENYKHPSLEESKIYNDNQERLRIANARKEKVVIEIRVMMNSYRRIVQKNRQLPQSQQIPHEDFLLDPRVTEDLENRLSAKIDLVQQKLQFDVEKSRIGYEKLMNYFVEPTDFFPFAVTAINCDAKAKILRHRKLTTEFFEIEMELSRRLEEDESKKRKSKNVLESPDIISETEKSPERTETFLMGLSCSTNEFRLTAKICRLLKQYRTRRLEIENRKQQWKELNAKKPVSGVNHPDDVALIQAAEATIGDFKLKSSDDYKPSVNGRDTTLSKYQQLLQTREAVFKIQNEFNLKVVALRHDKVNLIEKLKEMARVIEKIHREIPREQREMFPEIPEIKNDIEFPEKAFQIDINIDDFKPAKDVVKTKFKNRTVVINPEDYVIQLLKLYSSKQESFGTLLGQMQNRKDLIQLNDVTMNSLKIGLNGEVEDTPWEAELRTDRLTKKLFEQDLVIRQATALIKSFDEDVEILVYERFQVQVKTLFKHHFMIGLIQELLILQEFEAIENSLEAEINDIQDELFEKRKLINGSIISMEASKRQMQSSVEKIKEIQQSFSAAVADNRFAEFLKRIFKKKFKAVNTDDEDDSDSSSDGDDDGDSDDDGSISSEKLMLLRLDENVCPPELDPVLFKMAHDLKNQRHTHEQKIIQEGKNIDVFKKDLENSRKKLRIVEDRLAKTQFELEKYQKEKQRRLNEVECLMVLRLSQIRNFNQDNEVSQLRNSLLFKRTTLEKLDHRIGELKHETLDQKTKHRKNINHLQRMKADCKYMETVIHDLNAEIQKQMVIRFGSVIDIEDLEATVLKRLIHTLRVSMINVREEYEKQLAQDDEKLVKKEVELSSLTQENTQKLNLLVVLEEERNKIREILKFQNEKEKHFNRNSNVDTESEADLNRILRIVKCQKLQIQALKDEINILKLKSSTTKVATEVTCRPEYEALTQTDENQSVYGIVDDILSVGPARITKFNTPVIRSMCTELIGIVYNKLPEDSSKANTLIREVVLQILECEPLPEYFMENVQEIVARILKDVDSENNEIMEEALVDNVADILWEKQILSSRFPKKISHFDDLVNDKELAETAKHTLKESVTITLASKKFTDPSQLQEGIEIVLARIFEQLPAEFVRSNEAIQIIVTGLNKALGYWKEVSSHFPINQMVQNILSLMNKPIDFEENVRAVVQELVTSYVKGELIPDSPLK